MKILLSVKPEYATRILAGTKGFEFRRRLATKQIDAIILYATYPVERIVGEVEVTGAITMSPTGLWEYTKKRAGISRKKFRAYFYQERKAHAYILGESVKYPEPKSLEEYGVVHPPQSFVYIDEDVFGDKTM